MPTRYDVCRAMRTAEGMVAFQQIEPKNQAPIQLAQPFSALEWQCENYMDMRFFLLTSFFPLQLEVVAVLASIFFIFRNATFAMFARFVSGPFLGMGPVFFQKALQK